MLGTEPRFSVRTEVLLSAELSSHKKIIFSFLPACISVLLCVCVQCPKRPEKGTRSLGLELQRVVSCRVGAGN